MIIIACLDDGNGMLFNKRRQSSDEVLTNRVAKLSAKSRLWVNEYSAKLFEKHEVSVSEDFLKEAADGEYCFVENADITDFT
ncbi:MAG: ribonuclease Z, partial [Acutalibacteraceae bacterium]|nr:ribonuclease Z [Acutalibacteraceae bacterium]